MEIDRIRFSLYSDVDIEKYAVCEILNTKMMGANSVYDERMGTLQNGRRCLSCGQSNRDCVGHFGFIRLNTIIIHPLYYKQVLTIIRCLCYHCHRVIITPDIMRVHMLHRIPRTVRLARLVDRLERVTECGHCKQSVSRYILSASDRQIYRLEKRDSVIHRTVVTDQDIFHLLDNIHNQDLEWLGYGSDGLHPKQMILRILPVLPPVARPYIISDNVTCDDDLTIQYLEIVKANNHLQNPSLSDARRQKYIHLLKFRIRSLFDNSSGSSKHSNGRPLRGIKKRLTGKEGLIRNNLMGKRVDKSARTVIGPDPTLLTTEIAIPPEIAAVLSYSVRVNRYNIDKVRQWITDGNVNYIIRDEGATRINARYAVNKQQTKIFNGDWILQKRDGKMRLVTKDASITKIEKGDCIFRNGKWLSDVLPTVQRPYQIEIGDVVERRLMDGDILLLNRQPTLHKGSMIAQKARIRHGKTIRMNLAVTKTFNADFDGDEMNIHAPASIETETELRELSSLPNHLISCQSSQPIITIVQDSLTGAYLMTQDTAWMPWHHFCQCVCVLRHLSETEWMRKLETQRDIGANLYDKSSRRVHGRLLFSMLFPENFFYDMHGVTVARGILTKGTITKKHLGGGHGSFLAYLTKEYGTDACIRFLDHVQFVTNQYLLYRGFSIGLKDCLVSDTAQIKSTIDRSFIKASSVEETVKHPKIREAYMSNALSGARDTGMMIAQKSMDTSNNFITTVNSGSKGDYFNIAQITGVVGQQYLNGQRIQPMLSHHTRTLPHYPLQRDQYSYTDIYESRGFVSHSFVRGLNMREFFFHAMTGREGITDTAMKTATSGYIQRRMIKIAEDIQIQYDGTVRNNNGSVVQFFYGDYGLDPSRIMINQNEAKCPFTDVTRIAQQLNEKATIKAKRCL